MQKVFVVIGDFLWHMKKSIMRKYKKEGLTGIIIEIIAILLIAWVAISFIDVHVHQCSGGTDAWWNFFNILIKIGEAVHGKEAIYACR